MTYKNIGGSVVLAAGIALLVGFVGLSIWGCGSVDTHVSGAESDCHDDVDNDLDGFLDCSDPDCLSVEGCSECGNETVEPGEDCEAGQTTPCTTECDSAGTRSCTDTCRWTESCAIPIETCNDVDDDCDGGTDEGLQGCSPCDEFYGFEGTIDPFTRVGSPLEITEGRTGQALANMSDYSEQTRFPKDPGFHASFWLRLHPGQEETGGPQVVIDDEGNVFWGYSHEGVLLEQIEPGSWVFVEQYINYPEGCSTWVDGIKAWESDGWCDTGVLDSFPLVIWPGEDMDDLCVDMY